MWLQNTLLLLLSIWSFSEVHAHRHRYRPPMNQPTPPPYEDLKKELVRLTTDNEILKKSVETAKTSLTTMVKLLNEKKDSGCRNEVQRWEKYVRDLRRDVESVSRSLISASRQFTKEGEMCCIQAKAELRAWQHIARELQSNASTISGINNEKTSKYLNNNENPNMFANNASSSQAKSENTGEKNQDNTKTNKSIKSSSSNLNNHDTKDLIQKNQVASEAGFTNMLNSNIKNKQIYSDQKKLVSDNTEQKMSEISNKLSSMKSFLSNYKYRKPTQPVDSIVGLRIPIHEDVVIKPTKPENDKFVIPSTRENEMDNQIGAKIVSNTVTNDTAIQSAPKSHTESNKKLIGVTISTKYEDRSTDTVQQSHVSSKNNIGLHENKNEEIILTTTISNVVFNAVKDVKENKSEGNSVGIFKSKNSDNTSSSLISEALMPSSTNLGTLSSSSNSSSSNSAQSSHNEQSDSKSSMNGVVQGQGSGIAGNLAGQNIQIQSQNSSSSSELQSSHNEQSDSKSSMNSVVQGTGVAGNLAGQNIQSQSRNSSSSSESQRSKNERSNSKSSMNSVVQGSGIAGNLDGQNIQIQSRNSSSSSESKSSSENKSSESKSSINTVFESGNIQNLTFPHMLANNEHLPEKTGLPFMKNESEKK